MKLPILLAAILVTSCQPQREVTSAKSAPGPGPKPECSVDDIGIGAIDAGFVNECRSRSCPTLKGVVTVTNGCPYPVGVEFQILVKDKSGRAMATNDLWLASTRNIDRGENVLSLDSAVDVADYKAAANITVKPIRVKRW